MVRAHMAALTPRKRQVFDLVIRGDTNKHVARSLGCTERTIKAHRHMLVLGLVLAAATKRTVSDYAAEKLWQPLGAEADATWIIDATGQEITFAYVNAVLRDWARLGLMLANRGNWQGKTVVPDDWLTASVANALPTDSPLAKYGYQIWYSADTRRFALRGLRGQFVFVDPDLKLVLVQTALSGGQPETAELFALWNALRAQFQQAERSVGR
jgi:CubicO group peptidase (beta-lactamase class C family)